MIQSVTTTITGADTGYLGSRLRGRVIAIKCVGATDANLTLVISGETTAIPILTAAGVTKNATTWFYPRAFPSQVTDGASEADARCEIPILNERVQVVVSVAATGTTTITMIYDSED